jgi:Fungal Zn(2)-Cys(6) binuclear cluster domain
MFWPPPISQRLLRRELHTKCIRHTDCPLDEASYFMMDQAGKSGAACGECRSRKIKCGRQLPECTNCQRASIKCKFPARNKRGSQTNRLWVIVASTKSLSLTGSRANDMAMFNGRLNTMENSLSHRMEALADLISQTVGKKDTSPAVQRARHQSSVVSSGPHTDTDSDFESAINTTAVSDGRSSRPISMVCNGISVERCYGPISTYSHLVHARESIQRLIAEAKEQTSGRSPSRPTSSPKAARSPPSTTLDSSDIEHIQQKYDSFVMPTFSQEVELAVDNQPLVLPPRDLLEASVELYLQVLTLNPPLFDKQTLRAAIAQQYSLPVEQLDESWVLCFNSIMLRSMGWKSKVVQDHRISMKGLEDRVLSLLLSNADRAIKNVEKFCGLRIVNVQALFLLGSNQSLYLADRH